MEYEHSTVLNVPHLAYRIANASCTYAAFCWVGPESDACISFDMRSWGMDFAYIMQLPSCHMVKARDRAGVRARRGRDRPKPMC